MADTEVLLAMMPFAATLGQEVLAARP